MMAGHPGMMRLPMLYQNTSYLPSRKRVNSVEGFAIGFLAQRVAPARSLCE